MKVSCSGCVGNARIAILKQRVPDPYIQRVEIPKRYAGFCVAQEMRPPDRRFGKTVAFEAAVDAVVHIEESIVGIFVACVEIRAFLVPRLLDCNRCATFTVERETDKPGISNAVEPNHC